MFVLDADVVIALVNSRRSADVGPLPVVITDAVWDELTDDDLSDQRRQNQESLLKAMVDGPTTLEPQTGEARTIAELGMPAAPRFGLGERSVIAYALHHPGAVAVLIDKFALHRAIEELGVGQVMSLHRALHALEKHGLPRAVSDATSRNWCRSPHRPPHWWENRLVP